MPATIAPAPTTAALLDEAIADFIARTILDRRPAVELGDHVAAYLDGLDYRLVEGHELAALHEEIRRMGDLLEVQAIELHAARCAALQAIAS